MRNEFKKDVYKVEGMTCSGCEDKIERLLKRLEGIQEAKASFSKNTFTVSYDSDKCDSEKISAVLMKAGYSISSHDEQLKNKTALKTKEKKQTGENALTINQFLGIIMVLLALYLVINNTVGFNFIPNIDSSMGYGVLFVIGLLTSLHCVAMCGGINLSQCIGQSIRIDGKANSAPDVKLNTKKENSSWMAQAKLMKPSLMYNSGRVVAYTIIGGMAGALGSAVSFSGWARGLVAILSGIFMIIMGISMLGLFPWMNKFTPRIPRFLRAKAGGVGNGKGPFVVGILNGLMPCGPLQAMQLYALGTGSFVTGALSMFFFSLGTVPLMFSLGAISTFFGSRFTKKMLSISAALVLILGLVMVQRGFALSGIDSFPNLPQSSTTTNQTVTENGVQVITTQLTADGYPEITVKKGIPVRWTIQADVSTLNNCNNVLIIPAYNVEKELKPGDNIIEFMPEESGTIPYSCWMGMITSKIHIE